MNGRTTLAALLVIGFISFAGPMVCSQPAAQPSPAIGLLQKARLAFDQRKYDEAISLARKATELEPKNARCHYLLGLFHDAARQFDKAIADFDKVLQLEPRASEAYQARGVANFKLGKIKEAISDFDRFLEANPSQAPQHWQRGIALYYGERYDDGRKQFELHQTVNDNDVENAVWHFLCVTRSAGLEKARASLINIKEDRRIPMMQVFALFNGKGTADDVLKAASAGEPSPEELKQRLFFAHLYLGLYFEATGNTKLAQEHIEKSAGEYSADHYMGDVARVHAKLRGWAKSK